MHEEMAAVRSQREAAELERHKLILAHQSEAAATHVLVKGERERERERNLNGRIARKEDMYGNCFSPAILFSCFAVCLE